MLMHCFDHCLNCSRLKYLDICMISTRDENTLPLYKKAGLRRGPTITYKSVYIHTVIHATYILYGTTNWSDLQNVTETQIWQLTVEHAKTTLLNIGVKVSKLRTSAGKEFSTLAPSYGIFFFNCLVLDWGSSSSRELRSYWVIYPLYSNTFTSELGTKCLNYTNFIHD